MQRLTEIKNRIRSISDTRKITGAMETISIAKMRKAMQKYESSKQFFNTILETMRDIVQRTDEKPNIFFVEPEPHMPAIHIVIASDKGMAGAYNSNVLKHVWSLINQEGSACSIFTIGHTAREFFIKKGCTIGAEFSEAEFESSKRGAERIAHSVLTFFNEGRVGRVFLSYTHMYENNITAPVTLTLLPLSAEIPNGMRNNLNKQQHQAELRKIRYDPSEKEVLDLLVPQYLRWVVYSALVQSSASEHYARRLAMSNATKNATEILEDLTIRYHRARQESITNELNEIITATSGMNQDLSHGPHRRKACKVRRVRPFVLHNSLKEQF